jgi:hypothetical protein
LPAKDGSSPNPDRVISGLEQRCFPGTSEEDLVKAFRLLFAVVLLSSLHAVQAQIVERALMSVNIPFAFTVQNTRLPAGGYVIYSELGHEWKLASLHRGGGAFFHVMRDETHALPVQSKLIFHRYGTEYVLCEIVDGNAKMKATLPAGKLERQIAGGNRQPEIAMVEADAGRK